MKASALEIMPAPGPPGSASERSAFIREKIAAESSAGSGSRARAGRAGVEDGEEESVGDEGADAMSKMLESFDDSDEDS